jgi:hypothetical protein
MYTELMTGFILCIAVFLVIVVTGSELFAIMAGEQLRLLRLSAHHAPLPEADGILPAPEPVSRYLSWATGETLAPDEGCVRIRHEGRIRFGEDGRWMPMGGEAFFPLAVPAFVWRSTILYAPGIWLETFDYYVDRTAAMNLNLFSVFPLNNGHSDAMKKSSLFRYLACTPLFPIVHASSSFIRWVNISETTAQAVISDNGHSAKAIVRFDSRGRIGSIEACHGNPARVNAGPGHYLSRFSAWAEMGGRWIPTRVASEIVLPEGGLLYAEYAITSVESGVPGAAMAGGISP